MRWRDALFAHWRVDPSTVAERLPEGLDAATYDGDAYLGVVAFEMPEIRPRGVPLGRSFPEVNLRTYVSHDGVEGVYFFDLDAPDPLSVVAARLLFRLPYYRASTELTREGDRVTFASRRVHPGAPDAYFDATYGPAGPPSEPEPGSLEAFLVEKFRLYTEGRTGLCYLDIQHEPWPLAPAGCDLRTNTLFEANGFATPEDDPLLHYSPGVDVTGDRLRRVDAGSDAA